MTTTQEPPTIVCPAWCKVTRAEHLSGTVTGRVTHESDPDPAALVTVSQVLRSDGGTDEDCAGGLEVLVSGAAFWGSPAEIRAELAAFVRDLEAAVALLPQPVDQDVGQ